MHIVRIQEPHPIPRPRHILIGTLLLRPHPPETESVGQTEVERISFQIQTLCKPDLHRCLMHRLNGQLDIVEEAMRVPLAQTDIHARLSICRTAQHVVP